MVRVHGAYQSCVVLTQEALDPSIWQVSVGALVQAAENNRSAVIVRAGLGALSEIGEEAADPFGDGLVPFDLARPAAFDGVLGELLFTSEPGPQARGVLARGEELRAAEVEVALAGPFGGCPQAVAEFEFGLEEVGLEPVQGVLADPAGQ